jgi:DNA-binding transcriptional LysR family regulator
VRLLSRTTCSVAPTEAGQQFLARLRPAFTDVQEALDQLSGLRDKPAGRLRLLIPRVAGTAVLGSKLAQFTRDYPDVVLDITTDDTHLDIVAGGFDAGIHFGEYTKGHDRGARVQKSSRSHSSVARILNRTPNRKRRATW